MATRDVLQHEVVVVPSCGNDLDWSMWGFQAQVWSLLLAAGLRGT